MLKLSIPGREWYDEAREEFMSVEPIILLLEHSLLSLSKWESKWKIPFLENDPPKTKEQSIDYIRCMTINKNVDQLVYYNIPPSMMKQIDAYINDRQTATIVNRRKQPARVPVKEPVTSDLIYYWMVSYSIPFEAQKWHLSRLLALIDVCAFKNEAPSKMSKNEILKRNAKLNKARCAARGTRG